MTGPDLIAAVLMWALLATGVLRAVALARHSDELASRQWERLARMRSASGTAFFPTAGARLELELAIADAVSGRRRGARRHTGRASATWRPASPSRSA